MKEKPLFISLMKEYYLSFRSGDKEYEIRRYGKRWNEKTCRVGRAATHANGFQKKGRLNRRISDFKKISGLNLEANDKTAVVAIWGAEALNEDFALIYCSRKINTSEQYQAALSRIEILMDEGKTCAELEELARHVEQYEEEMFPID